MALKNLAKCPSVVAAKTRNWLLWIFPSGLRFVFSAAKAFKQNRRKARACVVERFLRDTCFSLFLPSVAGRSSAAGHSASQCASRHSGRLLQRLWSCCRLRASASSDEPQGGAQLPSLKAHRELTEWEFLAYLTPHLHQDRALRPSLLSRIGCDALMMNWGQNGAHE